MARTTITIGATARQALEQYEACERELAALPAPRLMADQDEWFAWSTKRNEIRERRAEAADMLASMVAVAMRLALAEREKEVA